MWQTRSSSRLHDSCFSGSNPSTSGGGRLPFVRTGRVEGAVPAIKDLTFDIDGLAIPRDEIKVEDTPVKMVIMGDAYLQREKTDKPNRFVCLIGEKGKVLLTFFTEQ